MFHLLILLVFIVQRNTVAYDEDQPRELEKALLLHDAISDLPAVAIIFLFPDLPLYNFSSILFISIN